MIPVYYTSERIPEIEKNTMNSVWDYFKEKSPGISTLNLLNR